MTELNAAQETKIHLLIESMEDLFLAPTKADEIADKRKELHDRLREFLLPAIRIIDGGEQATLSTIKVVCQKCGSKRQCLDHGVGSCPDWAASIKAYYIAEDSDGGAIA